MIEPAKYCKVKILSPSECAKWLDFKQNEGLKWLLGFAKSGLVWGFWDETLKQWQLSDHSISETIKKDLIEIRFFGPNAELLLWSCDSGFGGRLLEDESQMVGEDDPFRPETEERILFGDEFLQSFGKFTLVGDRRGARQKIPIACGPGDFGKNGPPLRLKIKNYFSQGLNSGMCNVALSRLCEVYVKQYE